MELNVDPLMGEMPLRGIKVIDATSNIAGPFGGAILGDLGADVIKVERPQGDPARSMVPLDDSRSAYFHIVNRNKDLITVDLKSVSGRTTFHDLLENADVFISNFLPHQLIELGLTPEIMRVEFPNLIVGNLSSYGQVGEDANRPGYDATIQARTGIMAITGEAGGEPVRTGVSVLDMGAGTWLALGVLAALVKRERFGEGSIIETSLYETGVTWVSYHLSSFQISREPSRRVGAAHPTFSPYGLFQALDGRVCIGVGSDIVFKRMTELINRPELFEDSRFSTNESRVCNREILNSEIESALINQSVSFWVEKLGKGGVPVDALRLPEDLLNDPQAYELDMLLANPDPDSKVALIPAIPLRINGVRPPIRKSAPRIMR